MHFTFATLLYAAALTPLAISAAQPAATGHPATPGAPTPPVNYESVFTGYRYWSDEKLAPWREVNDEAARIGGHPGIFGSGAAGYSATKPATNTPAPAAAAPRAMHGKEGMKK